MRPQRAEVGIAVFAAVGRTAWVRARSEQVRHRARPGAARRCLRRGPGIPVRCPRSGPAAGAVRTRRSRSGRWCRGLGGAGGLLLKHRPELLDLLPQPPLVLRGARPGPLPARPDAPPSLFTGAAKAVIASRKSSSTGNQSCFARTMPPSANSGEGRRAISATISTRDGARTAKPPRSRPSELPASRPVRCHRSDSHRASQGEPVQVPRRRARARGTERCRQSFAVRRRWPAAGAVDLG